MILRWNITPLISVLCGFTFLSFLLLDAYPTEPVQTKSMQLRPEDIAIVLAWDQKMEEYWVPRTLKDKQEYARRHGYDLLLKNTTDDGRAVSWSKIINLRQAMLEHPDKLWFWWLDMDTLIMEPQFSIEEHVLEHASQHQYIEKDIVMSWDCFGLNTGSMFMRNSDWSLKFLEDLLTLSWHDPIMYGEQRKMQDLFHTGQEGVDHFDFIPLRKACAAHDHKCDLDSQAEFQYNYHKGDFLIHFANCAPDNCHSELDRYHSMLYSR
ncbi:alpha-1,6-mannosyltransferase [Basidiobolus ranarum]|uniref:Alpha-1,6-mannosyltransferase n=1 Tax=Basidiobolus ranarum TaxID=34480 RepID=A0ABR2VQ72_9FUNG